MRTADVTDHRARTAEHHRPSCDDFPTLTQRYQRELLAHCYRMSGSVHEAEDLVQETFLRAWKASADFQGRSSVRTWLYRIATNVCLTNLEGRPRRPLPAGLGTADPMAGDALEADTEIPWLEPVPDAAVVVAERDSIRLAFIAALQHLPARQRAVLILRDVLRWSAAEVAEALDTTTAAVNSALQRAHAQLQERGLTEETVEPDLTADQERLLERYVEAFWRKDIDTIVSLLTAEAVWEMPPFTGWYVGADNIGQLIDTQCPGGIHDMPMLPTQRQRPAGVRALHAHPGGRLRAVPPPGARPRRRPGQPRGGVLRRRPVRPLRPARAAARRLRPVPASRGDHGARRAPSSCWTGHWATPGSSSPGSPAPTSTGRPRAATGTSASCSPTWRTPSTRSPRPPAGAVDAAGRVAGRRLRVDRLQDKACALLGAWSGARRRRGAASAGRDLASDAARGRRRARDHRARLGRRPGARRPARPDPGGARPRPAPGGARCWCSRPTAASGSRAPVAVASGAAPADERLLAFLGPCP